MIVTPSEGWTPPLDAQVTTRDTHDALLEGYWLAWVAQHAPREIAPDGAPRAKDVYGQVLSTVLAHGLDLSAEHWEDEGRPCARIYAITIDQAVRSLCLLGISASEPSVRSALRWLQGIRRPRAGETRGLERSEDAPLVKVTEGRKGHVPRYILRLPDGMIARGSQPEQPRLFSDAEGVAVDLAAERAPVAGDGDECFAEVVRIYTSAARNRGRAVVLPDRELARARQAFDALVADGWTWDAITGALSAYLADWSGSDKTGDGRLLKKLSDWASSTTAHGTPDTRFGAVHYLAEGDRYPELGSRYLSQNDDGSWSATIVVGEYYTPEARLPNSAGLSRREALRALAEWWYSPAAQTVREFVTIARARQGL